MKSSMGKILPNNDNYHDCVIMPSDNCQEKEKAALLNVKPPFGGSNYCMEVLFFLTTKERRSRIPTVIRQTVEPIKLFGLNMKPIKIILNAKMAKIVVNGNHFTRKAGCCLYWDLSFNCAEQIPIQINIIVNPGIVIR
jgi:hypothetical protein